MIEFSDIIKREKLEWKRKSMMLIIFDSKLEKMKEDKKITRKKYKKIRNILDDYLIGIWDFHPNTNPSIKKDFKLNFG